MTCTRTNLPLFAFTCLQSVCTSSF